MSNAVSLRKRHPPAASRSECRFRFGCVVHIASMVEGGLASSSLASLFGSSLRHYHSRLLSVAAATAAHAGCEVVYVIPGKPGVPVIINNHEARWAVVEGDCGLNRPGHMAQTVIGGRFVGPLRGEIRPSRYYPTTGQKPVQGRDENEPPADRQLPPPAEEFSRSWSSSSKEPVPPADLPNTNNGLGEGIPNMPPMIIAPRIGPKHP